MASRCDARVSVPARPHRAPLAVSYLRRFCGLAAADGGEERVPASAEPLAGRGSARAHTRTHTQA